MKSKQEDKKEKAIDMYLKGKFSIETAARFCNLYIGEFLELLEDKGVELNVTLKNYEEGLKNLRKI